MNVIEARLMTAAEFRESLRKLGLPLTAVRTSALLGVTSSALCKYAYGDRPVHGSLARTLTLLELLAHHGLPPAVVARLLGQHYQDRGRFWDPPEPLQEHPGERH